MRGWELTNFGPEVVAGADCAIHPTALFGRGVRLGDRVAIGPNALIHDNVTIGDDSWIGPGSSLGEPTMGFYLGRDGYEAAPTTVGRHALVRVGCVINAGTRIGDHFQTGPNVAIRERCRIGDHVSVGNNGDIQHEVEVGDYTRIHSNVTVGSGTRIAPFVWVHPYVVFTNDRLFPTFEVPEPPVIGPFSVIAVNTVVLPGAILGVHVVAGAGCEIAGRIPAFSFLKGAPAARIIDARRMVFNVGGKPVQPYPWIRRVDRGYPWALVPPLERRVEDFVPDEWRHLL